jgi:hypothetical protein
MEQLRAILCCSRPRSYRRRSTSLILRMDTPFWGIQLSSSGRGKLKPVVQRRFLLQTQKPDPELSISIRVRPAFFAADIHIPGIRIHIRPEFLFTSLRNPYSHRPEYAVERCVRTNYRCARRISFSTRHSLMTSWTLQRPLRESTSAFKSSRRFPRDLPKWFHSAVSYSAHLRHGTALLQRSNLKTGNQEADRR